MSVALIVTDLGVKSAPAKALLMKFLSVGLTKINDSVNQGLPVAYLELFDGEDSEFGDKLLQLLEKLDELGCKWKVMELGKGEIYSPYSVYYEVTVERLKNMLGANEREMERQRMLGWLEDGAPED